MAYMDISYQLLGCQRLLSGCFTKTFCLSYSNQAFRDFCYCTSSLIFVSVQWFIMASLLFHTDDIILKMKEKKKSNVLTIFLTQRF